MSGPGRKAYSLAFQEIISLSVVKRAFSSWIIQEDMEFLLVKLMGLLR